jgi:radical SAM protein with 4Fe4S-binding SPASM domain
LNNKWKGIIPKPLCIAPWKAISINSNGEITPDGVFSSSLGNLNQHTLEEIWNGEKWTNLRQHHLDFVNHDSCKICLHKENQVGHSRRNFFETFFTNRLEIDQLETYHYPAPDHKPNLKNPILRPKITDFNSPDFIYLDINTSNKCNLKCIHCNGKISTAWAPDEKLLKKEFPHIFRKSSEDKIYNSITKEVVDNLFLDKSFFKNLQFVAFRGGEPFYESINIYILEKLIELGWHKKITLDISTNATVINQKFFDLIMQFKQVILYVSIEGVGPMYQYCRGGQHYTQTNLENMLNYFTSQSNFEVCIAYTVMANNIFNIKSTWDWFQKYRENCTITFSNSVVQPRYLSMDVLSKEIKQLAYDMIEDIDDEIQWPHNKKDYSYSAGIFKFKNNLLKTIKNPNVTDEEQLELFKKFKEYINALDTIRGTDFLSIEPIYRKFWNE